MFNIHESLPKICTPKPTSVQSIVCPETPKKRKMNNDNSVFSQTPTRHTTKNLIEKH